METAGCFQQQMEVKQEEKKTKVTGCLIVWMLLWQISSKQLPLPAQLFHETREKLPKP